MKLKCFLITILFVNIFIISLYSEDKNNQYILKNTYKVIEEFNKESSNKIKEVNSKCFDKEYNILLQKKLLLSILIVFNFVIIACLLIPKIKKNIIKNKIRTRINKNKYLLQYQPIYNPRNNNIIGFEVLLRLLDKNNKLISPKDFIPEIEKNNMLFEITIWILKEIINDYSEIKTYECVINREFYISLNVSLNEIENDEFIKKSIDILDKSNLGSNKICLEIIERVKINNLDKIIENIDILKNRGFKIAIDDFGVEYSNLDILRIIDTDIIKVDKHFVDGIGKDIITSEIILFISRIAKAKNKVVILEGVEKEEQNNIIKQIEDERIYVQGYFYSKPIYKENIKKL